MIIGAAPENRAGAAAGISETAAELGGALGIAILGSIGLATYRDTVAPALESLTPEARNMAMGTLGGVESVAKDLPSNVASSLVESARAAFSLGLEVTSGISAMIALAMGVVVLRRGEAVLVESKID